MKVEIDKKSGFCFGVINAIRAAENELNLAESLYCLGDIVHNGKEVERLEKSIAKLAKEVDSISKKLDNESFMAKAPDDVVEKVRSQYQESKDKMDKYIENVKRIKEAST